MRNRHLLAELEKQLGYRFHEIDKLELALTHRSWCAENAVDASNERLEFLGDSVLGLAVTDRLFRSEPILVEGQMSKARAAVVNAESLADRAKAINLGDHIRLGKGEQDTGGRSKLSILADAFEAVIGAIYLDGGLGRAHEFISRHLGESVEQATEQPGGSDYKTLLQEGLAKQGLAAPSYSYSQTGPHHDRCFRATVTIAGEICGVGEGTSKKQAQQRAARVAYDAHISEYGVNNV